MHLGVLDQETLDDRLGRDAAPFGLARSRGLGTRAEASRPGGDVEPRQVRALRLDPLDIDGISILDETRHEIVRAVDVPDELIQPVFTALYAARLATTPSVLRSIQ